MVYPVDGGMEDWLYASGWDKDALKSCNGLKDINNNNLRGNSGKGESENRALVFLVEASDKKVITDSSLGESMDVRHILL